MIATTGAGGDTMTPATTACSVFRRALPTTNLGWKVKVVPTCDIRPGSNTDTVERGGLGLTTNRGNYFLRRLRKVELRIFERQYYAGIHAEVLTVWHTPGPAPATRALEQATG